MHKTVNQKGFIYGADKWTMITMLNNGNGQSLVNRRSFLTATGAGVAGLSGCLGGVTDGDGSGEYAGETLTITAWGGVYADNLRSQVKDDFEEETGATLEIIEDASGILSQIEAAPEDNPPFDATITEGFFYYSGRQSDLFEEVRYENVPNIDNVYSYYRDEHRTIDYGAPVTTSPMGIIYRDDIGWEPSEWEDLMSDEAENISVDGGFFIYPYMMAAIIADEEPSINELYDENSYEAVFDVLEELDIVSFQGEGSAEVMFQELNRGAADIAQWYYPGSYQRVMNQEDDLSITLPTNNASYVDSYCPVRGTQKRDLVETWINFLLDEEVQNKWAQAGTMVVTPDVDYPEEVADVYPTTEEEVRNITYPDWDIIGENMDTFFDHFDQLKSQ